MKIYLNLFCWPNLMFCFLVVMLSASSANANQPTPLTGQTGPGLRSLSGHGENFEVILKFSPFKTGNEVSLTAYILDSTTNEPIQGATLIGDMSSGGESVAVAFKAIAQSNPGSYEGKTQVLSEKPYSWLFDVSLGERNDLVAIDGFKAGEDDGEIPATTSREPNATGYELKLTQTEIFVLVIAFMVFQGAIIYFVRKKYTFRASPKDLK